MKKNLQRFGASVLAAAMVAQSVALPAAAETTKIDSSVAQSVAASAASAAIPMASRNGTGMTPTRRMAIPIPGKKPPLVTGPRPMTAGLTPLCIPVKRAMPTRR